MTGKHEVWIARIYDRDAKSRGVRLLIDFLHALTDPAMLDLHGDLPMSVPSGLPVRD